MFGKIRYTTPPLPFIGNKRNFLRQFADAIKDVDSDTTFIDCFGGSGLLSRCAKDVVPGCRVIYNDFDGYRDRVAQIDVTNAVLREIREMLADVPRGALVPKEKKADVLDVVARYEALFGTLDIRTIAGAVAFSGKSVGALDLTKQTLYNRIRFTDIPRADDYFDGLEVVSMDFRDLLRDTASVNKPIYILDPPYLSTNCDAYAGYGGLTDSLDVLYGLRDKRYVYFSSDKSEIESLTRWLASLSDEFDAFAGAKRYERTNSIAKTTRGVAEYKDLMYVKI